MGRHKRTHRPLLRQRRQQLLRGPSRRIWCRRASIEAAEEEIWWVGKYLTEKGVDVDLDTVLDGNYDFVKAHRYLARLVHSYVGMWADPWVGDRSHEVVGMGIGMVYYGCRRHSAREVEPAGIETKMVRAHIMTAVVDSS